jgi:hypothetical protein
VYRAPDTNIPNYTDEMNAILNTIKLRSTFICGDFNIDILKYESHQGTRDFMNVLFNHGCYPIINLPTRIQNRYSLIDNIFTNVTDIDVMNGLLIDDLSDHLPVFALLPHAKKTAQVRKKYKYIRIMNEENLNSFTNALYENNWSDILECVNVNEAFSKFLDFFTRIYNKCIPLKRVKMVDKCNYKPWYTSGLKNACKKKNNLYKNFLKFRSVDSEQKYKKYKNKLPSILRSVERKYYADQLAQYRSDIKKLGMY